MKKRQACAFSMAQMAAPGSTPVPMEQKQGISGGDTGGCHSVEPGGLSPASGGLSGLPRGDRRRRVRQPQG